MIWSLGDPVPLGLTPIEGRALPQGSYLLTITHPGFAPTRYPAHLSRSRFWSSGEAPIPLLTEAEIGPGFLYVPAGPALLGEIGEDRGQGACRSPTRTDSRVR